MRAIGIVSAAVLLTMIPSSPLRAGGRMSAPRLAAHDDRLTVELIVVKLADLEKAVKAHRGKLVVLYLWGDYSVPDRVCMAQVVAMNKRLAKGPLVIMTVCHSPGGRGDPEKLEARRRLILEHLTKSKADFQNFLLDEDDDTWAEKLAMVSGPTFLVYDRSGKKVKLFSLIDQEYCLADVERFVKKLIGTPK